MFRYLMPAALLLATGCTQMEDIHAAGPAPNATGTQKFLVLELFTSQGCSSCPPADALLQKLKRHGPSVFALSFHVDYWNRLGWKDPYSQKAFSERQRAYARHMRSNRVYTPQLVVNGEKGFVGSDQRQANQHLRSSMAEQSNTIQLNAQSASKNQLNITYNVDGNRSGQILNVAVVETGASNKVPRGENAGRQLQHVNVVRVFRTVELEKSASGVIKCDLPPDLPPKQMGVIAFTQNVQTWHITGASRVSAGEFKLAD